MSNIEIIKHKQRLDHLFHQVKSFSNNPELQAQWARYLCILTAGFIETSVQAILNKYIKDKAAPNVANYGYSRLKRFTNPNMEDILTLLGSFDTQWRQSIEIAAEGELKDAVDGIMASRNLIAHGVDTGTSYTRVHGNYQSILTLVQHIENICV